jgi:signal transduction histidine kinase
MSSWGLLGFGILVAVLVGLLTHGILVSRESARAEATHRLALLAAVPDHMIRLGPEMETLAYHRSAGLPSIPCHLPAERWMPPRLRVAIERAWAERRTTEAHVDLDGRSYAVRVVPEPERFLVLSLRDITDQQKLEEERTLLTELVRSNGQLAAVFGQDGRLEYLNPAGQRMLGLQLPTSAPLESFLEAPEELTRVLGGGPGWSGRLELRSRSGVDIPAQVAAFPIQTAHGSKLGILALDLRETVELERRLLQSQKLQAIGTLAAGVAHDFNNALTVFRAGLELVEEHPGLPADLLEDTALMRQAEASATQVARQLLAFSRPGPMDEGCFPVDEVLAGAAKMFARIVRDDIELSWDLSAEGARVDGDPGALQQVILNLVSNARDALQGGGRIHVSTRKTSDRVSIAVSDDGVGMPEAQLARAFEPFFTTKSVGRGTGLGLAMVKRVTEELGGTVDLESARGVGTKVSLHLPLAGASTRSPRPRRHLSVVRPRARVVLAEDDPAVRAILARGLKRAGHLVAEAADGDAALARLEEPADALVADVVMPGLGGEALARRAREASPEIFVVLMSGHRDLDWQALRENTGFEVLAKPIAPRTLLDAIAAHLATRGAS